MPGPARRTRSGTGEPFPIDAAERQVSERSRTAPQRLVVEARRSRRSPEPLLGRTPLLDNGASRTAIALTERSARTASEPLRRKPTSIHALDEVDDVAACAAAEAEVVRVLRVHDEARLGVGVERASPLEAPAKLAQLHAGAGDDLGDWMRSDGWPVRHTSQATRRSTSSAGMLRRNREGAAGNTRPCPPRRAAYVR